MRLLLIEDNSELVLLLRKQLPRHNFEVDAVDTAADADQALASLQYGAVVLDLGLPDRDGLDLLRDLRRRGKSIPVLVLTARDSVSDRVTGLRAGADDYLVKPFAVEELVARLEALQRRPNTVASHRLTTGNLALDVQLRQIEVDGSAYALTERECAVLEMLLREGRNVVRKRKIEDQLFGLSGDLAGKAVEVYIHRLRSVLSRARATATIKTIYGVGYFMAETSN